MDIARLFSAAEVRRAPLRYDLLRSGKMIKAERLLTRKDGGLVPVGMNSRMMPDGSYHSILRDISEWKQAEQALRLSEEKFSRAFHLSPDAININRASDGTYLEVNQGFLDLSGYSAEEVLGRCSGSDDLRIWSRAEDRNRLIQEL